MVIDASINDTTKAPESTFRDMAIHDGAGLDEEELRFRRLSLLSIAMLLCYALFASVALHLLWSFSAVIVSGPLQ